MKRNPRLKLTRLLSGCKGGFKLNYIKVDLLNGPTFRMPKLGPEGSSMANTQNKNGLRVLRTGEKAMAYVKNIRPFRKERLSCDTQSIIKIGPISDRSLLL